MRHMQKTDLSLPSEMNVRLHCQEDAHNYVIVRPIVKVSFSGDLYHRGKGKSEIAGLLQMEKYIDWSFLTHTHSATTLWKWNEVCWGRTSMWGSLNCYYHSWATVKKGKDHLNLVFRFPSMGKFELKTQIENLFWVTTSYLL